MRFSDLKKNLQDIQVKTQDKAEIKKQGDSSLANSQSDKKPINNPDEKQQNSTMKEEKDRENSLPPPREVRFSIRRRESEGIKIDNSKEERNLKKEIFNDDIEFERSRVVYSDLIWKVFEMFKLLKESGYLGIYDLVLSISDSILNIIDNYYILNLTRYLTPNNYLYSHILNLSILAGFCAKEMNYSKEDIRDVIIGSLMIDIGMINYRKLYSLERNLERQELEVIKGHIEDGIKILEKIFSFDESLKTKISELVYLSHERYDGSGYWGVESEKITEKAGIIMLCDVYEAMSHRRSYRMAYEPPFIISSLMQNYREKFNQKVLKVFVSFMSLYPYNSIIKLSTGEIAKVIMVNKERIARPIVKVIADFDFNKIDSYIVDLSDFPLTSIEGWVKYKELALRNPSLYKEEEFLSLWIDPQMI